MSYRAIYTYAWDLAEAGVDPAIAEFKTLGLDTVTIAGSYHAGKFLRPHGIRGKVYFPEDGTVYFKTDPAKFADIKPIENSLVRDRNFDAVRELAKRPSINTNVWLVLLHNSILGARHTECCTTNAFGDKYIYSLCPSARQSIEYAYRLCREVSQIEGVTGISVESPGFAPYVHGYHHEFALNRPNRWLDNLLGLCFCSHCMSGAKNEAGLDIEPLRQQVVKDISEYLASDIDFPDDMAEAFWLADVQSGGLFSAYLHWRCAVVTRLVQTIRRNVKKGVKVAVIPSVARPTGGAWYEGSDLAALAKDGGIIEACFYEPNAQRVKSDLFDIKRRLRGSGELRGILRPAWPDLNNKAEFLAAVDALAKGGVSGIAFYNWGHLRRHNLSWIDDAMEIFGAVQ